MEIAIIGTGRVGSALGRRWAAAGHTVVFGSRRAGTAAVSELEAIDGASVKTPVEAVSQASIVVLATPWPATEEVVGSLGTLAGKILIDCTNPVGSGFSFEGELGRSGAEQIASWANGAHVVKAFNTTGAKNMASPIVSGDNRLAMFICGDDDAAKATVTALAEELGFDVADAGALSQAFYLETLAMLWISQAFGQEWGPDFGFAILRR